MGCPGVMSLIRYTRINIYALFLDQSFVKFSYKKIVVGKKIVVPCLDLIMIAFPPRNIQ